MKRIVIASIIGLFTLNAIAQEYEEVGTQVKPSTEKPSDLKTVFPATSSVQGFASLDLKVSSLMGSTAIMPGFHGGIILNRHLIVGVGGYGIANSISYKRPSDNEEDLYLYGGYGGLMIGAIVAPNELVHLTFPLLLGVGGIHTSDQNLFDFDTSYDPAFEKSSVILVAEPGVELEINVARFFRVALRGSYRMVGGSQIDLVTNESLSDFSGGFSLKFGSFR